jgi:hypothetical protein
MSNESNRNETPNRAMKSVDHTHPDTDRPFGDQVVFARGPVVAADGGREVEAAETEETDADEDEEVRMKDVDHEPPNDADANRVFERGREGRDGDR